MIQYKRNLIPSKIMPGDPRLIKVHIPENEFEYVNGEGEVLFAYILDEKNIDKHKNGVGYFEVVLLMPSECFKDILNYGHAIIVDTQGPHRPIMDYDWFLSSLDLM